MNEGTANSLLVVDVTVYAWSIDRFYALATSDGTEQWTFETSKELGWSPPVLADGTAYVESSDGTAYALTERQLRCS